MTEQELREKIINTIKENGVYNGKSMHRDYYVVNDEELADALIAAELTFDKTMAVLAERENSKTLIQKAQYYDQMKHRAEVAERALRNAAPRLKCRGGLGKGFCRVDKCDYYHCNNDEGCVKAHLRQAEKQLAEEKKNGTF